MKQIKQHNKSMEEADSRIVPLATIMYCVIFPLILQYVMYMYMPLNSVNKKGNVVKSNMIDLD